VVRECICIECCMFRLMGVESFWASILAGFVECRSRHWWPGCRVPFSILRENVLAWKWVGLRR
jgi:hypothetical protein